MKSLVLAAICISLVAGTAGAAESYSFDPASVRFGYADGYWDHEHRWHSWPNAREARDFRHQFQDKIFGYRHTRYPNDGWRDDAGKRAQPEKIRGDKDDNR